MLTECSHVPEKDPLTYDLITYAWVVLLSVWGGVAGYVRKLRNGQITRFSITEIIGDVVVSAFVGVMTFFVCESADIPPMISAAFIGISAHMGSRAIFLFESAADRMFQRLIRQKIE
jgi:hypothetical protein